MNTTTFLLNLVKRIFPSFEFTWLGDEMRVNLPLEMDFRHEAANAARCVKDFSDLPRTTLVVPEVLWAKKRVMAMECASPLFFFPFCSSFRWIESDLFAVETVIQGGRVDDLNYLAVHNIDRNAVSREIAEITSRMIYVTGFFHADLFVYFVLLSSPPLLFSPSQRLTGATLQSRR
jgi:aarF domain-containing kinase